MERNIILVGVILLVIAGLLVMRKKPEATPPTPQPEATPVQKKAVSLDEISKHNSETDCWFAVEGKVYDVTKFIASNKHPGGKAILEGCGKDATELFNTRPMGSKTAHSDKARSSIANFYIADLQTTP